MKNSTSLIISGCFPSPKRVGLAIVGFIKDIVKKAPLTVLEMIVSETIDKKGFLQTIGQINLTIFYHCFCQIQILHVSVESDFH